MTKVLMGLVFVVGALGCTPSPEKVCNHVMDIAAKEAGDKMSDEKKTKMLEKCVKEAGEEKEKDPDRYKCIAKCAMASTDFKAFRKCDDSDTCPKKDGDKAKKSDDESDKKAKKSDDDDSDKKKKKKDDE
jgi:hypothetical protein